MCMKLVLFLWVVKVLQFPLCYCSKTLNSGFVHHFKLSSNMKKSMQHLTSRKGLFNIPVNMESGTAVVMEQPACEKEVEKLYSDLGVSELLNAKPFSLARLPFNPLSLEPFMSYETIKTHYGKHHANYIRNINSILSENGPTKVQNLEQLVLKSSGTLFNNAAQAWNHAFFWECLRSPAEGGGGLPNGITMKLINQKWESFDRFKSEIMQRGMAHFGSGWIWVVVKMNTETYEPELEIFEGHDATTPLSTWTAYLNEKKNVEALRLPVMVIDIWEHAFYLDHKSAKRDYLEGMFKILDWRFVESQLKSALNELQYGIPINIEDKE